MNDKTLLMLLESMKPYLRVQFINNNEQNQNYAINYKTATKYLQLINNFYSELKDENLQKMIRNRMEEDFKIIFKMIEPLITAVIE